MTSNDMIPHNTCTSSVFVHDSTFTAFHILNEIGKCRANTFHSNNNKLQTLSCRSNTDQTWLLLALYLRLTDEVDVNEDCSDDSSSRHDSSLLLISNYYE